ncbi:hypothetical protein CVT24_007129 [Panaeolus cyanescens]|uniref:Uncharacterized protein n=1 Tax=Panaeolus cyanescens TaxID=181874 RepID=A0A409VJW7_9AGAR|nr:hypothetical protein CVT24_007129 [Panaeolus cyanescens]
MPVNDDVLRLICLFIRTDDGKDERLGASNSINSYRDRLMKSAQAFRALKEPALDALWHTLPSFVPLFSLHPNVVLENGQYVINPTKKIHWGNFDQYALRVKCMLLDKVPPSPEISPYVAEFLTRLRPGQVLLPALKSLHLYRISEKFDGSTLLPVISGSLDTVEVNAVHNKTFVTTLLCYIGQFAPNIRVLKARRVERPAQLLRAIQNLYNLNTLEVENETLNWQWFCSLHSHLPNLRHISLGLSESPIPVPNDSTHEYSRTETPQFKLITLRVSGPETASLVLDHVDPLSLEVLTVKETKPGFNPEAFAELLAKINQLTSLTRLTMEIREVSAGFDVDVLQTLSWMKCRASLEELNLSGNKFITKLSDQTIADLARDLPALKRLYLPTWHCTQGVYPTLESLLLLGNHCPSLQEVRLPLQDLHLPPNHSKFTFSNNSLQTISISLASMFSGNIYSIESMERARNDVLARQVTPQLVEMLYNRFPKLSRIEANHTHGQNPRGYHATQEICDRILGHLNFGHSCTKIVLCITILDELLLEAFHDRTNEGKQNRDFISGVLALGLDDEDVGIVISVAKEDHEGHPSSGYAKSRYILEQIFVE